MVAGLYKKIKWLMVARLIVTTIILVVGSFFLLVEKFPFYCIISSVYLATIIFSFFLRKKRNLGLLAYSQIIFDVLVETAIIHYSGGIESIFAILYVLSIISGSIVISAGSSIVIASVASILYATLVGLEYFGIIPQEATSLGFYQEGLYVLYLIYVRVTIFCLVGFLCGYLARRISQVEKRMMQRGKLLAMGEFAASIAHQIRNPLASLSGSIELLSERLSLDEPNRKLMEVVVKESGRLGKIIDQFLEYTRREPLEFERHSLNELLSEALALAKDSGKFGSGIELIRENEDDRALVRVDRQQIKQALLNIITNAIEAMQDGGRLTVGIKDEVDYANVRIVDTGVGIPRGHLKRIFEPFQKTTKGGGAGTGLAIANCIVEDHGGTINVRSRVGHGSTFTVRLPK